MAAWPLGALLAAMLLGAVATVDVGGRVLTLNWLDLAGVAVLGAGAIQAVRLRLLRIDVALGAYLAFGVVVAVQFLVLDDPGEIVTGAVRFALAAAVLAGLSQLRRPDVAMVGRHGHESWSREPWAWPALVTAFGAVLAALVLTDLGLAIWEGQRGFYDIKNRVDVPLGASNYLAAFLLVAGIVATVFSRPDRRLVPWSVLVWLGLVGTLSRGAFVAAFVTGLVALAARYSRRLAVSLAGAAVAGLVLLPLVAGATGALSDVPGVSALLNREDQFVASWDATVDNPAIGVGLNRYQEVVSIDLEQNHENAHNLELHALAETGVLGALAYLAVWVLLAVRIARMESGPPRTALALAVLALFLHAQVEALAFTRAVDVLVAALLAIAAGPRDLLVLPDAETAGSEPGSGR